MSWYKLKGSRTEGSGAGRDHHVHIKHVTLCLLFFREIKVD